MRSPSLPLSEYDSGSPDPLASPTSSEHGRRFPSKRIPSSTSRKQHTRKSSADNVSILPPSSPSRTVTEQTLSPWKIRVTVEAEPEDQMDGLMRTMTKTMKVPLRGEDEPAGHTNQRYTRPHPRSRTGSPPKGRQRSVTPAGGRRRRQSVTDLDIVVLGDDAEEDEWAPKARGSPQRKPLKKATKNAEPHNMVVDMPQDTDDEADEGHLATEDNSPELRQIDMNKVSVRSRANSAKQKVDPGDELANDDEPAPVPKHRLPAIATRRVSNNSAMSYPTPSPTISERGNSDDIEKAQGQIHEHAEGFDTIMESEGFTMIDLDTIPSVRQMLSSPPEDQISSNTNQLSPIVERDTPVQKKSLDQTAREPSQFAARAIPSHLELTEGESEISSTVPSSPPVFPPQFQPSSQKLPLSHLLPPSAAASQPRNRLVTPHTLSSPTLPSPPRQMIPKERSAPDSAQALKAGIMLQGAVDPADVIAAHSVGRSTPKESNHMRSSSEEIFEGFDSGTKRELRAGLRFGEELAKRQQPTSMVSRHATSRSEATLPTNIWRGESVMSRTPVQTFQEVLPGEKHQGPHKQNEALPQHSAPSVFRQNQMLNSEAQREHEYQLEKKAVSRQIEEAGSDKVVVIDSDHESSHKTLEPNIDNDELMEDVTMGDDDGGDIWLEEAKDASSSPRQSGEQADSLSQSEQFHRHDGVKELTEQPRRSTIPSPWKRGEPIGDESTALTNGEDMSGLFWKQPQEQENVRFGDAAIRKARAEVTKSGGSAFVVGRTSGAFDIEKMLGTPKRIRESLDREKGHGDSGGDESDKSSAATPRIDEDVFDHEEDEDSSQVSLYSEDASVESDTKADIIVVNFNDSTLSESEATPPQKISYRAALSPSAARPPTPRSALKGSRQSFGAANGIFAEDVDQTGRKVVFAERSRGVNIDWVESSSSILSGSAEADSPTVEHQRHHEERQQVHSTSQLREAEDQVVQKRHENNCELEQSASEVPHREPTQKGWFGWLRKSGQPEPNTKTEPTSSATSLDGPVESKKQPASHSQHDSADDWAPTSRNLPAQPLLSSEPRSKTKSKSTAQHQNPIPSYLLPPSYPSDPTRSPSTPLSTTGNFTNTHFRTLNIIHAKSQRARFHAPRFAECRPQIRDLAHAGWKLTVDESAAGLGRFEWSFGELEARALERFCREVEFGWVTHYHDGGEEGEGITVRAWLDRGVWSGIVGHGEGEVEWGWGVERLATWLGRIVVGEVVRKEECTAGAGK